MEPRATIGDAEERYLVEITVDCDVQLGPGAELLGLAQETDALGVRLRVRYRIGGREHESEASGTSLLDAHRALRDRILIDRVRYGFTDLIAPD